MRIPTITIDRGGQPVTINAADFNPRTDRRFGQADQPAPAEDDRDTLLAALAELGIKPHGRTGTDKLRGMLDEARARAIVASEPED